MPSIPDLEWCNLSLLVESTQEYISYHYYTITLESLDKQMVVSYRALTRFLPTKQEIPGGCDSVIEKVKTVLFSLEGKLYCSKG
jgi:hypothetical protein